MVDQGLISRIISMATEHGLAELEVRVGDLKVMVRREGRPARESARALEEIESVESIGSVGCPGPGHAAVGKGGVASATEPTGQQLFENPPGEISRSKIPPQVGMETEMLAHDRQSAGSGGVHFTAGKEGRQLLSATEGGAGRVTKVTSPLVGVFYRAPSPGASPFVEVGDHVTPGQTLCIVEAMKIMNEIQSEVEGDLIQVLPENGNLVEEGETLFLVSEGAS